MPSIPNTRTDSHQNNNEFAGQNPPGPGWIVSGLESASNSDADRRRDLVWEVIYRQDYLSPTAAAAVMKEADQQRNEVQYQKRH